MPSNEDLERLGKAVLEVRVVPGILEVDLQARPCSFCEMERQGQCISGSDELHRGSGQSHCLNAQIIRVRLADPAVCLLLWLADNACGIRIELHVKIDT